MTTILSIDPGVTTGIIAASDWALEPYAVQTVPEIIRIVDRSFERNSIVLIENFIGGGYRTQEAVGTLKTLGFVEHYLRSVKGVDVIIRPPQYRKPYVRTATRILNLLPENPLTQAQSVHAADALAHLLSFIKEHPEIEDELDRSGAPICKLLRLSAESETEPDSR